MPNKELINDPLKDEGKYLKQIIKHLIELNNYPDININYFITTFGYKTRVEAELICCTGAILIDSTCVDTQELQNNDFKNYIEERLLREVAYKYVKRAFEKREAGKVKAKACNFLRNCQSIQKGGEDK